MHYSKYGTIKFNTDFKTNEDIEKYYMTNHRVDVAIVWEPNDSSDLGYHIRMPYDSVPNEADKMGSTGR